MQRNIKQLLFGGPENLPLSSEVGLLILRLSGGLTLALAHGLGKVPPQEGFVGMVDGMGFPVPVLFAWLAGIAELFGGILVAIGLLTRPAALLATINMAVAFFIAHGDDPFRESELAMIFGFIMLTIVFTGSGRLSVDRILR